MAWQAFRASSLKARISILAVLLFVLGLWTLSLYVSRALSEDMQDLLGKQQFSTARLVASEVEQALFERMRGLQGVARQLGPEQLRRPEELQRLLENQQLLQHMFSAGLYTTGLDGTVNASVPVSLGRLGVNFRDRPNLVATLEQGQSAVSAPVLGKFLKVPVVSMSTPILDPAGRVVGALVGVISLQEASFLDHIVEHPYGQTGDYQIVDASHTRYVTATDRRLANQPVAPEIPELLAPHEFEGYAMSTNAAGVATLNAVSHIPSAGWHVLVRLPAEEALAPQRALEWRIFGAAALLTLLVGTLMWWVLRVQLQPLAHTARALQTLSGSRTMPNALPLPDIQEIAQVVAGFNQLLAHLRQRDAALQQSEQRYRAMSESAPLAMCVQREGRLVYLNPAAVQMFGARSAQELLGRRASDFVFPESRPLGGPEATTPLEGHSEQLFVRLDGTPFEVEVHSCAIVFDGADALHVTLRDLSLQREQEAHVRKLSRITEQAPMAIAITDLAGSIEYTNPWFSSITGYTAEELRGKNPRFLQSGQTPAETYDALWRTVLAGQVWQGEFHNRKKNGEIFVESATIAPVHDAAGQTTHYVALKQDVTLRKQTELALQNSLKDKVALLHEVHHRVKNNLQVITSLLRLEAAHSAQAETREVMRDMQSRIRTMALLHETLYRSGTFTSIDLSAYLRQLCSQIFRSHSRSDQSVALQFDLQSVSVDMDLATPCGLLVNELLTNSLKHAFAAGQSGAIRVTLQPQATAALQNEPTSADAPTAPAIASPWLLRVQDNGIGLPADFAERSQQSLGLQLVGDLVQQLHGRLHIEPGPGAGFSVYFGIQPQKAA